MTQSSRVLATRCPHCHTVFRVVADQLKLRDGLVRCGHCREVFDGRAYLCDPPADESDAAASAGRAAGPLDAGASAAPPAPPTSPAPASSSASSSSAFPVSPPASPDIATAADLTARPEVRASAGMSVAPTRLAALPDAVTAPAPAPRGVGTAGTGRDKPVPEMLGPTAIAALLGSPDESRARMQHGPGRYIDDEDPTVLTAPTASPARRETPSPSGLEQHKRPGVARALWRVCMALAVIGLLAQWAWIERAALVDRMPALHGVFAAIGRPLHVPIGLPRQPDQIQISSVTLVTDAAAGAPAAQSTDTAAESPASDASATPAGTVPMTLTVFMRNQAGHAVAWPSLELTLSDLDGKPVVRRVFSANEYVTETAMRETGLAPRNERTIRLRLSAQAALASNYRVLAFYP